MTTEGGPAVNWKIKVKHGQTEVEVVGLNVQETEQLFERIAKKAKLYPWEAGK